MAAIHRLKIESDLLKTGAVSPELVEELFRTVTESISYELEVGAGVTAAALPGLITGPAAVDIIQTFVVITDTSITINFNGANVSMVVNSGQRRAVFIAYGISTTTVPTVTNSGSTIAILQVMAGGT